MTHIRFRALAAAMVLAGTAAMNSAFAAGETSIAIDNFTFTPAEVTVKAGTKVLFVNHDDIPHLVVLEKGKVRSRALDTDEIWNSSRSGSAPWRRRRWTPRCGP